MDNSTKIRLAYIAFLTRFRKKCTSPLANNPSISFNYNTATTGKMALNEPIYLKNWPYKTASSKEFVDILIDASETVSTDDMSISESWVKVSYFKLINGECDLLESLHYDFKEKGEEAHPIFHVQLCHQALERLPQDFQTCRVLRNEAISRHQHIRIPTAHMSLISVLVSIVADHLGSDMLKELIKETMKIGDLPRVDSSQLFDRISGDNKNFRCFYWYPEGRLNF